MIHHPFSVTILESLARESCPTLVVVDAELAKANVRVNTPTVRVHTSHLNARLVANECDLSICYGQHGSILSALCAGKPLMMVPLTLEQKLHSERVAAQGAGLVVNLNEPLSFETRLQELLSQDGEGLRQATSAASRFAVEDNEESGENSDILTIVDHIESVSF